MLGIKKQTAPAGVVPAKESVWASIQAGIRYLWMDKLMRFIFTVLTVVNFLLIGPIMVGIPVLADQRLPEGATAFGLLMSGFAGGNLLGYLVVGSLPRPNGAKLRLIVIALFAGFGIVIGSLGILTYTWLDFGLLFVLGLGNGFLAVLWMTWMQTRTPKEMLGRMMALLMFSSTRLMPISQAISGALQLPRRKDEIAEKIGLIRKSSSASLHHLCERLTVQELQELISLPGKPNASDA